MVTTYQGLFGFVAAWLLATNPTLTADKIVYALQPETAPRVGLPYVSVQFTAIDTVFNARDELVSGTADAVEVTGGTSGTVYSLTANATPLTYTRTSTDTDATTATALAALISGVTGIVASATVAVVFAAPRGGYALVLTTSDPNLDLTTGHPYNLTRGMRRATASIQTYGGGSAEWLMAAVRGLGLPSVLATLKSRLVWPTPKGGIRNLSALRDTNNEQRSMLDVDLDYIVESGLDSALAALYADFHITASPGAPDIDFTVGLT